MSNQAPMSVRQAAAALHLHPRKVIRLIESGELNAFKAFEGLRAPWMIPAEQVDAYQHRSAA